MSIPVEEKILTYQFAHLGINPSDECSAAELAEQFVQAFQFPYRELPNSLYVGGDMELMKQPGRGKCGHIGIQTNDIVRAIEDLKMRGFTVDMETASYREGKLMAVYLNQNFGEFSVHLLER